jgi:hypothetical protein
VAVRNGQKNDWEAAMRISLKLSLAAMVIAAPAGLAAAEPGWDAKAAAVLEKSKTATGGAAWDRLEGFCETGMRGDTPYSTWMDFRAYGQRVEVQAPTSMAMGYNGATAWRRVGQEVTTLNDEAALSEARISAYVSNNAFFFPDRFRASAKYVRRAKDKAGRFDVIEIAPEGARAVRLWFDRHNHRLARIEDFAGTPPVTVTLSDYRPVDEVLIAFDGIVTDASGKLVVRGRVKTVVFRPVSRSLFEPGSEAAAACP